MIYCSNRGLTTSCLAPKLNVLKAHFYASHTSFSCWCACSGLYCVCWSCHRRWARWCWSSPDLSWCSLLPDQSQVQRARSDQQRWHLYPHVGTCCSSYYRRSGSFSTISRLFSRFAHDSLISIVSSSDRCWGGHQGYLIVKHLNYLSRELYASFRSLFNGLGGEVKEAQLKKVATKLEYIATNVLKSNNYLVDDKFSITDAYLYIILRWSAPVWVCTWLPTRQSWLSTRSPRAPQFFIVHCNARNVFYCLVANFTARKQKFVYAFVSSCVYWSQTLPYRTPHSHVA